MKKKLLAVMLVVVMVLGSFSTVFAAPTTVKISTTSETHTYEIYQIFKGDVNKDDEGKVRDLLTDLVYGENAKAVDGNPRTVDTAVTTADMAAIDAIAKATYPDEQAKIAALAPYVDLDEEPLKTIGKVGDDVVASADVPSGYYLIKDKDNSVAYPETYTLYLLQVVNEDMTISPKGGEVEEKKKVDDKNDSNQSEDDVNWQDTADYDIGDHVPYKLTFKLPGNYDKFIKYYVEFFDDMCEGLTLDTDSVKIYFGASDTTGQSITFTEVLDDPATDSVNEGSQYANGHKYHYVINDLKTFKAGLAAGTEIRIEYTATLNNNAVIGNNGNPNEYWVKYSNNPNNSGDGTPETGETPHDKNVVFTYQTIFNKVDGKNNPITGADFELYKFVCIDGEHEHVDACKNDKDELICGFEKQGELWGKWTNVTELNEGTNKPSKIKSANGAVADSVFTFKGLDDGLYKLVETVTPDGYNGIPDQIFTITAKHAQDPAELKLTELTGTDGASFTLTPNVDAGSLTTSIVNKSGSILPETGGIGTTILYTLGGILVVGAGVLLVARRKMER